MKHFFLILILLLAYKNTAILGLSNVYAKSNTYIKPSTYHINKNIYLDILKFRSTLIVEQKFSRGKGGSVFVLNQNFKTLIGSKYRNGCILNYQNYSMWSNEIKGASIYKYHKKNDIVELCVQFHVQSHMIINLNYYIKHRINYYHKWVMWAIDMKQKPLSYLKKTTGFWVLKNQKIYESGKYNIITMIIYFNSLKIEKFIPEKLKKIIISNGLGQATLWIDNVL